MNYSQVNCLGFFLMRIYQFCILQMTLDVMLCMHTFFMQKNVQHPISFEVACTSAQCSSKILNGYPIFSIQIIDHQFHQMHT